MSVGANMRKIAHRSVTVFLQSKGVVDCPRDKECKRRLAHLSDVKPIQSLETAAPAPYCKKPRTVDIVGDGSSDEWEVPKVDKPLTGEPTPAADAESSSSESTADERGVVGAEDDDFFRLPDKIFGRHLSIEMHSIHKTVGVAVFRFSGPR